MQAKYARQLRREWADRPCLHPAFDRLMWGSLQDGYVCLRCGQEFTPAQRATLLACRQEQASPVRSS